MPKKSAITRVLELPAIRVEQSKGRVLYTFAVDGKCLPEFAAISRIHRNEDHQIIGYQRPEVMSHVSQIREYIDSESPMIPNAIVVAFDSRVEFVPARAKANKDAPYSTAGTLLVPVNEEWDEDEKPGFVVDGQQRLAAIREASLAAFPICVTAFVTDDIQEQTEQFILVNSTKPLPKGLIYELLPSTSAQLPTLLHRRRFPSLLVNRLNYDEQSPFKNKIQTPTNPDGNVKDNSILRMLEGSLYEGALYRFRDPENGEGDVEQMLKVLFRFWGAVADVFREAWDQPPKRSRLMHGAGIVSMGFIMDAIVDRHRRKGIPTAEQFKADLTPLVDVCSWTNGYWDFGPTEQRKWNEIQNTSKDIALLTNFLLHQYRERVWSKGPVKAEKRQVELPI